MGKTDPRRCNRWAVLSKSLYSNTRGELHEHPEEGEARHREQAGGPGRIQIGRKTGKLLVARIP